MAPVIAFKRYFDAKVVPGLIQPSRARSSALVRSRWRVGNLPITPIDTPLEQSRHILLCCSTDCPARSQMVGGLDRGSRQCPHVRHDGDGNTAPHDRASPAMCHMRGRRVADRRSPRPVHFSSRTRTTANDGGHRASDSAEFLSRYGDLVDQVTGIVSTLIKDDHGADSIHTYTAGNNFALHGTTKPIRRGGLRGRAGGKGMSDVQARASALGEAAQRYSGVPSGFGERETAQVRPDRVPLLRLSAATWTRGGSGELKRQRRRNDDRGRCPARILRAGRRDAVALWWYNRVQRPGIDIDGFPESYFATWRRFHERSGWRRGSLPSLLTWVFRWWRRSLATS